MKIFEIDDPYFALIVAENEEKCMDIYEEVIFDVEGKEEFLPCIKELETTVAITKVANAVSNETNELVGIHEAGNLVFSCLNSNKSALLALDGDLF